MTKTRCEKSREAFQRRELRKSIQRSQRLLIDDIVGTIVIE